MIINDHKARQILILASQSVSHPRTHTWITHQERSCVPFVVGNDVIIGATLPGADHGQIIHHGPDVGKQLRHFDSRLAVLLEPERAAHQRPGIALAYPHPTLAGEWLAMELRQHRLGIEGVHVADATTHEQ